MTIVLTYDQELIQDMILIIICVDLSLDFCGYQGRQNSETEESLLRPGHGCCQLQWVSQTLMLGASFLPVT